MFQTGFVRTWTFDPIFCQRGYGQQYNTLMTQLFGIFFGQTLLFSLFTSFLGLPLICNPRSFLRPFFFAPLFLFSLTLHCFISRLLGWKEFRWRPRCLFPSSANPSDLQYPPNPLDPRDPTGPQDPSDHKTHQAQHPNKTNKTLSALQTYPTNQTQKTHQTH